MATVKTSQVAKKQRFNIPASHITTMDMLRLQPVYYRRLIPGQEISVNVDQFVRLADMPAPTFGGARLRTLAFFVPYRTVWKPCNDFFASTYNVAKSGVPDVMPYVTNSWLVNLFLNYFTTTVSSYPADIELGVAFGQFNAHDLFNFTPSGAMLYKVLQSLGIQLDFSDNSPSTLINVVDLLSFLRVVYDWLYSRQLVNDSYYVGLSTLFDVNGLSSDYSSYLSYLLQVFDRFVLMPYGSNRYTDAFFEPNQPNMNNSNPSLSITPDDSVNRELNNYPSTQIISNENRPFSTPREGTATGVDDGVPSIQAYGAASPATLPNALTGISYSMIQALESMTAYIRRNQISGCRAFERVYAMFGIKPDADVFNRSYFIGEYSTHLQVSDVMSTSATSNANLGSYAGKGFIIDKDAKLGHFSFKNDSTDFGLFILCSYIEPRVCYPFGMDPMQMQLSRLQFYTGDFDGLGTEPIVAKELYAPVCDYDFTTQHDVSRFDKQASTIFAYTPRYSAYKQSRDWLTGDFRLASRNQVGITSDQWHFARMFDGFQYPDSASMHIDTNFLIGNDAEQYNRIFYYTGSQANHFVCQFLFDAITYANMKPLYDFDDFEHEDDHKDVNVSVGGINV